MNTEKIAVCRVTLPDGTIEEWLKQHWDTGPAYRDLVGPFRTKRPDEEEWIWRFSPLERLDQEEAYARNMAHMEELRLQAEAIQRNASAKKRREEREMRAALRFKTRNLRAVEARVRRQMEEAESEAQDEKDRQLVWEGLSELFDPRPRCLKQNRPTRNRIDYEGDDYSHNQWLAKFATNHKGMPSTLWNKHD